MQKHVNLVDLIKSFPTNIYLQNLASIQKRTSPLKFDHLAEKSEQCSISNLSTKVHGRETRGRDRRLRGRERRLLGPPLLRVGAGHAHKEGRRLAEALLQHPRRGGFRFLGERRGPELVAPERRGGEARGAPQS